MNKEYCASLLAENILCSFQHVALCHSEMKPPGEIELPGEKGKAEMKPPGEIELPGEKKKMGVLQCRQ